MTYQEIAEKCLNKYWGSGPSNCGDGWDNGCNAHILALQWAKKNIRHLCRLSFNKIYKEFLITLRQE